MQRNWIGRSEGARVKFPLVGGRRITIEVFTTRIDTIYGATSCCSRRSIRWSSSGPRSRRRRAFREQPAEFQAQDRTARMTGEIEKEGFDTGRTAINPFTEKPVPIWVANFVLGEYGTGAVMGVPGARPARLRVRAQVQPADHGRRAARRRDAAVRRR